MNVGKNIGTFLFTAALTGCAVGPTVARPFAEELETVKWQDEIDRVAAAGGGVVRLSDGRHRVGCLLLKDNVTLEIPAGAVLEGSTNITDYVDIPIEFAENPEPWQALVAAIGRTNVAVVGAGEIDGSGAGFTRGIRVGRPQGLLFLKCRDVRVEGLTLRELARWTCYFKECERCVYRKVRVDSHANWNNDGVDIDAKDVLVEDCDIDADDDGIVLKSDNPAFICENVEVRNCRVRSCASLFKLGTGSHGGFRNIHIHDCRGGKATREVVDPRTGNGFLSDYRAPKFPGSTVAPCPISGIAIECVDGGLAENIHFSRIEISEACVPIFVRLGVRIHRRFGPGNWLKLPFGGRAVLRNVLLEDIRARACSFTASSITGVPQARVRDVTLRNVVIEVPGSGEAGKDVLGVPVAENENGYPEAFMFGYSMLPAYGFYVRHADDVLFENVTFKVGGEEFRPAIHRDDVGERLRETARQNGK